MEVCKAIIEQLESCLEQEKEIEAGREDSANFLKLANILLTIDAYIKILDEGKYVDTEIFAQLQKSWKVLLEHVKPKLPEILRKNYFL
jgi:hypothetical protein